MRVDQQLQTAKDELTAAKTRLRDLETELAASKERCSDQAADLFKKSGNHAFLVQDLPVNEEAQSHMLPFVLRDFPCNEYKSITS